jgi:DNA-binding transcriptional LysR family regulator
VSTKGEARGRPRRRPPEFSLVHLRYFARAAALGSISEAARELLVSQSAVSTAIAQLERQIGLQLFVRHPGRGLSPTPEGIEFLAEVRNLLVHADDVAGTASRLGESLDGRLSVGSFVSLTAIYFPRILTEFATRFPSVEVDLVEGDTEKLEEALLTGRCELAVLYDLDLPPSIERDVLAEVPAHVLVSADHRLRDAGRVHLAELAGEPLVLYGRPGPRQHFLELIAMAGVTAEVRHRSGGIETVRSLVAAGHGWALLHQRPPHDVTYDGRRVVTLEIADPLPGLPVVLARPRNARLTHRARAFQELLREMVPRIAGRTP